MAFGQQDKTSKAQLHHSRGHRDLDRFVITLQNHCMSANPISTDIPTRPCLRRGLAAVPQRGNPRRLYVFDQLRINSTPLALTYEEIICIELFNGQREIIEIQEEMMRRSGGIFIPQSKIAELIIKLDQALFLDSPRLRDHLNSPVREPSCIGCYAGDPDDIRTQVRKLFTDKDGPGLPRDKPEKREGKLRAVLVPHMDYGRGGVTYGWGFRELIEQTDARLFVIVGTAHYSPNRFTLTRQHFKTPLGTVETDQDFINRLESHYGEGLFDDPIAHIPEHSIELEVVLLQFLYEGKPPIRIVPLVVGSFADCVFHRTKPGERDDIARMIQALKNAEAETDEPICYIISGDLAHIGPKFDDPEPLNEPQLKHSKSQDEEIITRTERADADSYFELIAQEEDERRICGFPPTYTVLHATEPKYGQRLHYGRYVHPQGHESVSFASVGFYG